MTLTSLKILTASNLVGEHLPLLHIFYACVASVSHICADLITGKSLVCLSVCMSLCLCRCHYGACEIPSVAALIGGIAAQEAIKVMTSQFIPLNNTFIYNAIKQTSVSLEL